MGLFLQEECRRGVRAAWQSAGAPILPSSPLQLCPLCLCWCGGGTAVPLPWLGLCGRLQPGCSSAARDWRPRRTCSSCIRSPKSQRRRQKWWLSPSAEEVWPRSGLCWEGLLGTASVSGCVRRLVIPRQSEEARVRDIFHFLGGKMTLKPLIHIFFSLSWTAFQTYLWIWPKVWQ